MLQNVGLSLALITALMPLALLGVLGLAAVVLVHEIAEVVAIANGGPRRPCQATGLHQRRWTALSRPDPGRRSRSPEPPGAMITRDMLLWRGCSAARGRRLRP